MLHGIQCLLAAHLSQGGRVPAHALNVDPRAPLETHLRRAAIIVRLSQTTLTEAEAEDLADCTLEVHQQESTTIPLALSAITALNLRGPAADAYFLRLLQGLPTAAVPERTSVIDRLTDSLRRRQSALGDPARWKQLEFRANLADVALGV
jgi:hypothetical protein